MNNKTSAITWKGKTYRSYETERAGKRGSPSEDYAAMHPFPTYSAFGTPSFVDQNHRQYKTGDGFDAMYFEQTNQSRTNMFWEPDTEMSPSGDPGELQFLYVRCPINVNKIRKEERRERLNVPAEGESLILIHLKTKVTYSCKVRSSVNVQNPLEACGSIVIKDIEELGTASNDTAERIKKMLPKKYKSLIKIPKSL